MVAICRNRLLRFCGTKEVPAAGNLKEDDDDEQGQHHWKLAEIARAEETLGGAVAIWRYEVRDAGLATGGVDVVSEAIPFIGYCPLLRGAS